MGNATARSWRSACGGRHDDGPPAGRVVSARMMGGLDDGDQRHAYEYAAHGEWGPEVRGEDGRDVDRGRAVAEPMDAMHAALVQCEPRRRCMSRVPKIPNWADCAEDDGVGPFQQRAESVMAPTPMKIRRGQFVLMPMVYRMPKGLRHRSSGDRDMVMMHADPRSGRSRTGSYSLAMAR